MKSKVTFLIVVECNLDEYPEDQGTEVYQGSYILETDGYLFNKDAVASSIASRISGGVVWNSWLILNQQSENGVNVVSVHTRPRARTRRR